MLVEESTLLHVVKVDHDIDRGKEEGADCDEAE